MTGNIHNIDLVNINDYIKLGQILSICSQDTCIERKQNSGLYHCKGPSLWYKCAKNDVNNPNLDLVNMNTYIKFGEILSIWCHNIERKQNSSLNHSASGYNSGTYYVLFICHWTMQGLIPGPCLTDKQSMKPYIITACSLNLWLDMFMTMLFSSITQK